MASKNVARKALAIKGLSRHFKIRHSQHGEPGSAKNEDCVPSVQEMGVCPVDSNLLLQPLCWLSAHLRCNKNGFLRL